MRIVSANVNGIRAAARRGGVAWLAARDADVVTLQEVRAGAEHLHTALAGTPLADWHVSLAEGERGRAGVAVLSRLVPTRMSSALEAPESETVGRYVEVDLPTPDGPVTVASAYVHTGEAGTPRQEEKYRMLDALGRRFATWSTSGSYAVVTGDLNVAHRAGDLKNWKGNRGKAGFLPEEQQRLDTWIDEHGVVDVHRALHGPGPGPYTWWSWRGRAFDNDAGWRIDYHLATTPLAERARAVRVGRAADYAQRWSDHAAVEVDYAI